MKDNKKEQNVKATAKIELLNDMIAEKSKLVELANENILKLDNFAGGSKESANKIMKFVESQRLDFLKILEKENINDIAQLTNIVNVLLNNVLEQTKKISKEAENLYLAKQVELILTKQELDKLKTLKKSYDDSLVVEKPEEKKDNVEKELEEATQKTSDSSSYIRPDKNPATKAGKAAMDLAERRKKYKNKN